jgi:uncharacterized protein (DUF1810 family)
MRFQRAQDAEQDGFAAASQELQTTGKRGHWIWYVFPQLVGLGMSSQSKYYGIQGRAEAIEYLSDPVLGPRLLAITRIVAERLQSGTLLNQLMGSDIDALKLVSSLTLFESASQTMVSADPTPTCTQFIDLARRILDITLAQGYARCTRTLSRLES